MSLEYAHRRGLEISSDVSDQVEVEFADGSTAFTSGLVKNATWQYADSKTNAPWLEDVYVPPNLTCDLILGCSFLHRTGAFTDHEGSFCDEDETDFGEGDLAFNIIRLVMNDDPPTLEALTKTLNIELNQSYSAVRRTFPGMPRDRKDQVCEIHRERRRKFHEARQTYLDARKHAIQVSEGQQRVDYYKPYRIGYEEYLRDATTQLEAESKPTPPT